MLCTNDNINRDVCHCGPFEVDITCNYMVDSLCIEVERFCSNHVGLSSKLYYLSPVSQLVCHIHRYIVLMLIIKPATD